jgi:minor tail protein Z (GPZ)
LPWPEVAVIKIAITHNFPEVQRQLDQLQKDIGRQALASAVNKTIAQAKTSMSRAIRDEFNISAGKVNAALRVTKASFRNGLYRIEASLESPVQRGRSINVINFQARKTSQGVSVKIKKGGARKVIRGAFIANKGRTVFQRVGKTRLPIKAVQTIDVAQMFNTKRINARVVKFMETKFPEVFAHESQFFLDKFNRGGGR